MREHSSWQQPWNPNTLRKSRQMTDQPIFAPFCPDNAPFYACDYGTRFLGCCADTAGTEVCAHGCSIVQTAGFVKDYYYQVTKNECQSSEGQWYTCQDTTSPFLGCCKTNPCSEGGCSDQDLVGARLSTNETQKAAFSTILAEGSSDSGKHTAATVGGVIGGTAVIIIACVAFWYYKRKHRKHSTLPTNTNVASGGNLILCKEHRLALTLRYRSPQPLTNLITSFDFCCEGDEDCTE